MNSTPSSTAEETPLPSAINLCECVHCGLQLRSWGQDAFVRDKDQMREHSKTCPSHPDAVDAARYRWLRKRGPTRSDPPVIEITQYLYVQGRYSGETTLYAESLDAAIDAALAAEKG